MSARRAIFSTAGARLLALAVLACAAGCAPSDPLDWKATASKPGRLAAWRAHIESDTGPNVRRRTEEAFQEIRLKVNADREVRRAAGQPIEVGPTVIDDAVCAEVDGRPLREILQLGYELRLARLKRELAAFGEAVEGNTRLVTKPGDLESQHYLEALRGRQVARLEKYRADIAAAERELAPLRAVTGKSLLLATDVADKPDEMPVRVGR